RRFGETFTVGANFIDVFFGNFFFFGEVSGESLSGLSIGTLDGAVFFDGGIGSDDGVDARGGAWRRFHGGFKASARFQRSGLGGGVGESGGAGGRIIERALPAE